MANIHIYSGHMLSDDFLSLLEEYVVSMHQEVLLHLMGGYIVPSPDLNSSHARQKCGQGQMARG